jgi:NADH dehydrogenase
VPVVVTGASGLVGRRAVGAFLERSPQVRAYVRRPDAAESLRALGAKVAVGEALDVDCLETVMDGAHTACLLIGGLDAPDEATMEEANLGSVVAALAAAARAGIRRILLPSYPGADPASPNAYLRFKGMAEGAVRDSGLEHVLLRCTHVYGPDSRWLDQTRKLAARHPSMVIGSGRQVVAPVFVDDVAAVLAAADDRAGVRSGLWGVEGPDRVDMDRFADRLAGRRRVRLHLSPGAAARAARLSGQKVTAAATEVLARDSLADAPDAFREFGLLATGLEEGLRRSASPAREDQAE